MTALSIQTVCVMSHLWGYYKLSQTWTSQQR